MLEWTGTVFPQDPIPVVTGTFMNTQYPSATLHPDAEALYDKGFDLYLSKDYEQALIVLQQASQAGSGEADGQLGIMHRDACGVPQDLEKAASFFRRGAERGDSGSQYLLGRCYVEGTGVAVDLDAAVNWLALATAQDNRLAPYLLADLEQKGLVKLQWLDDGDVGE